jgi:O-antigen/teichoic acid export membrane protein
VSLLKNIGALSVANIAVQGVRFAYSFVFRMILGPQLTGVWNLVNLVLGYLAIATAGIAVGAERKIPILRGKGREEDAARVRSLLFSFTLLEAVAVCLLLWGYIYWRGAEYGTWEVRALAAAGVYALLSRIMACYVIAFRTIHEFVNLSKIMVTLALLDVVIVLPAIGLFSFPGLLVAFGISSALKLVWYDRIRKRHGLFPIGWNLDVGRLKELLSIGFPIMIGNYLWRFFVTLDSLLVVWIMGTTSLAYYTVGAALLVQLSEIPTNVSTVLTPRLFEKFGESMDIGSLRPDLMRFFSGTLLCIAPLLCTAGFFGIPFLVRRLIPDFAEGIVVVRILVFALFFVPQTHIPNQILILLKRRVEYSLLIVAGIVAVASCVLTFHAVSGTLAAVALGALSGYALYFLLLVHRVVGRLFGTAAAMRVHRRVAASFLWCSAVLWGIAAWIPDPDGGVLGDLVVTIGKALLALLLIGPVIRQGGREIGLYHSLVDLLRAGRSKLKAAGGPAAG